MDFGKRGGGKKRGGWKTKMDFDKRGGVIFFLWRVEFLKIGKRGPHVYQRDESTLLTSTTTYR